MTQEMRAEFEAWAAKNYIVPPGVGHLFVRAESGDGYRLTSLNHAWHGWQASRDAIEVELPDSIANTGTLTSGAVLSYKRECAEALQAQGLKVKP